MDVLTYGQTYGWTKFLPILQDFVPCWARGPATFREFVTSKKQGKRSDDLMIPFGNWFMFGMIYTVRSRIRAFEVL